MPIWLRVAVTTAIVLAFPAAALAGTSALQPFPTNLDTVADSTQLTGLRVNLPLPPLRDLPVRLRRRRGAQLARRLQHPAADQDPVLGPDRPETVSSSTIFLVGPGGHVVGINQPVWEPLTNTLYVESDEQLAQDSTYLLVVTRGIHDANGNPLDTTSFRHDLNFGQTKDPADKAYRKALLDALPLGARRRRDAERHRRREPLHDAEHHRDLRRRSATRSARRPRRRRTSTSAPDGSRTVFANVPGLSITWNRQVTTSRARSRRPRVPVAATQIFPGSIATIAYGSFASPDYENAPRSSPRSGRAPASRRCRA